MKIETASAAGANEVWCMAAEGRGRDLDVTRYVRRDVMDELVGEDLILFDAEAGQYYATTEAGREIWAELAKPVTLEDVCRSLMARYDVENDVCARETRMFIEELRAAGLVATC
jgi:hypothetical protein